MSVNFGFRATDVTGRGEDAAHIAGTQNFLRVIDQQKFSGLVREALSALNRAYYTTPNPSA